MYVKATTYTEGGTLVPNDVWLDIMRHECDVRASLSVPTDLDGAGESRQSIWAKYLAASAAKSTSLVSHLSGRPFVAADGSKWFIDLMYPKMGIVHLSKATEIEQIPDVSL